MTGSRSSRLVAATLGVVATVAVLGAGAGTGAAPPASYIVVFKGSVATDAKTLALEHSMGFVARYRYHAALHGFAARLTDAQRAQIAQDADVAFVGEDGDVQAVDSLAPGETAPTGIRRVNAATTTTTQGAAGANVAVIDTGIGLSNTDLNATAGKNCVNQSSAPEDDNGHGTHVSGTIGAKNTGSRVVGVAPNTKLYAVKVLNSAGSGTWAQVICGVDWVTANASALGIKVASMSLGGGGSNDNNCGNTNLDALHLAICNSKAAGVTYVVAAGNNGANFSSSVPAAYPEAVTVTAVSDSDGQAGATGGAPTCRTGELDDKYATFSNYAGSGDAVATAHTIAAPGVCIISDWLANGTNTISGTSMATPHVSGLVALCVAAGSCTAGGSPSSIIGALQNTDPAVGFTGDPQHSPVAGRYYGYLAWFAGGTPPPPPPPPPPPSATVPTAPLSLTARPANGKGIQLGWLAPASDGGSAITGYRVYRGTTCTNFPTLVTTTASLSYKDTSTQRGAFYCYVVRAVNSIGESPPSNSASATAK